MYDFDRMIQNKEDDPLKILVLSDSHSSLRFMYCCVEALKPDAIIHLGDYFDDGQALREDFPHIPVYQVPGNCDSYRCSGRQPQILVERIFGVDFYLTHGHRHNVKMTLGPLLRDARACKVAAVLYGHTHVADLHQEDDCLWVMNPGSCGYFGGSAGLIEVSDGQIRDLRILRDTDITPA